jgi:UDP-galactopyranose mutase
LKGRILDKDGVNKLVPIPPTQETVNQLFGESISNADEMQAGAHVCTGKPVALTLTLK